MTSSRRQVRRFQSLRLRIEALGSLRGIVRLPEGADLSKDQWSALESQLGVLRSGLLTRLKTAGKEHLASPGRPSSVRAFNEALGQLELDLAQSFSFFDTYMDILTQRQSPVLGPLLAGCDVLAADALHRDHPALAVVELPLVYCDRGFGASTLREGIRLQAGVANPMPLVQIPYSRLKEKHNLTSILHEAGHEAMVRLGLHLALPALLRRELERAGAPRQVTDLFCGSASEIGPDFWGVCAAGVAAAGTLKEILALPHESVFRISLSDPHPPPYLRVLLVFEFCRSLWGRGPWDDWEREWTAIYRVSEAPPGTAAFLRAAVSYAPRVSTTMISARWPGLNWRSLPDLFPIDSIAPARLTRKAVSAGWNRPLAALRPSAHLAVFRLLRERGTLDEAALDRLMSRWLVRLGASRANWN